MPVIGISGRKRHRNRRAALRARTRKRYTLCGSVVTGDRAIETLVPVPGRNTRNSIFGTLHDRNQQ